MSTIAKMDQDATICQQIVSNSSSRSMDLSRLSSRLSVDLMATASTRLCQWSLVNQSTSSRWAMLCLSRWWTCKWLTMVSSNSSNSKLIHATFSTNRRSTPCSTPKSTRRPLRMLGRKLLEQLSTGTLKVLWEKNMLLKSPEWSSI